MLLRMILALIVWTVLVLITGAHMAHAQSGQPAAHQAWMGPTSGGVSFPKWRSILAADLPTTDVQSVVNDTNIQGSISNQVLTFSWAGTLAVARGGTGGGTASGTLLDNITGFSSTGYIARTGSGTYSFTPTSGVPANTLNTQTVNYSIATTDCGKTIQAGTGSTGFFTLTVPSVAGFATNCVVTLFNGDTTTLRGKAISGDPGCSSSAILWPGQSCTIGIVNGAWVVLSRPGRWRPPENTTINFFTDFTNGSDTNGVTDGLASGSSAFKSAEHCFLNADDQIDYGSIQQLKIICNLAAATTDTQGMHSPVHGLLGAQGGAALQFVGASLSISGAISNGGLCEITVASGTGTYSANEVVSVYGVGGATGCNGTWKVTVTDGTHLTLQSTTFGGSYTSGGTVTNGSAFNTTGVPAVACYFGTVMQFSNILFQASGGQGINPQWGCKIYLNAGNVFGSSAAGIFVDGMGQIRVEADIGISATMTNAFVQAQHEGLFMVDLASNLNFLPGVNPSFSGLAFAYADSQGQANFANLTIVLNSNTVTGTRCAVNTLGLVNSNGTPNTYFPGNANCTTATGGIAN